MQTSTRWERAPSEVQLEENEVQLWRASLDVESGVLRRLGAMLAPEEKSRAAKFIFPSDRDHFIAARGVLRELLGAYLNCAPAAVDFAYGPQGKPILGNTSSNRTLRFNLSHAGGLAVYAFALGREVGADIEPIRPDFAGWDIAKRFFSSEEIAELESLPPVSRSEAFFLCWTRKEAYIKARGEGLQIPLDSFHVTLTPRGPVRLASADSSRWTLRDFQPAEGYAGALVVEGPNWNLSCWEKRV
jgi:4'-phosphopantetheinyl transferase